MFYRRGKQYHQSPERGARAISVLSCSCCLVVYFGKFVGPKFSKCFTQGILFLVSGDHDFGELSLLCCLSGLPCKPLFRTRRFEKWQHQINQPSPLSSSFVASIHVKTWGGRTRGGALFLPLSLLPPSGL